MLYEDSAWGMSEWNKLILAISYTESKFKTDAVGNAQDFGCLQITPVYCSEAKKCSTKKFYADSVKRKINNSEIKTRGNGSNSSNS